MRAEGKIELMKMDRRELLKTLGSTTVAATLAGILPEVTLAQAAAPARDRQQAPERLLQSEPVLALSPEGEATLEWETVVPTQGAAIYLGIPNERRDCPGLADL